MITMYKFRWIIFLSIIFLNYSFLHTNYKFLKNNFHHLHLYKYETEYYDFYNKFKHPILSSSQNDTIKSKLIEKNKNSYLLFERNLDYITNTNKILSENNDSLVLGINQFADSVDFNENTNNDLMKYSINKNTIINNYGNTYLKPFKNPFSYMNKLIQQKQSHNWNNTEYLSPVKNQERCGSCWAFSTTSAIETFMRMNNYTVDRLSEQELVDCSIENNGCNGGIMHKAMDFVIEQKGLHSNEDYPYNGVDNNCTNLNNIEKITGSNITKYEFIIPKSPLDMMISVSKSPIALGLDANNFYFRFYKEGVIDVPSNFSQTLNHAVLLVGYDYDEKGFYWIIQNSWGESWGDKGFCKIRIKDNLDSEGALMCQVYGVYPTK